MKKNIYLDYAATTPVSAEAFTAALPYYKSLFYNPASSHSSGQIAGKAIEHARESSARAINAAPREIIFTSGGTEAINTAILNVAKNVKHAVFSAIEHDSALACAEKLKSLGADIDYVMPTPDGIITPQALEKCMRSDTSLVCVMTVNNIVGTVQDIAALCEVAHRYGALFFTDAVQAVNSVELDVKATGVDMLAVSGHKFYAPKGSGFLYVKSGLKPDPLMLGGEQEFGLRAGTVDVPAVVGMGEAIAKAVETRAAWREKAKTLANEFTRLLKFGKVIAPSAERIDEIVSVMFDGINGGRLAVALSCAGVSCSVGSACSAGSATPPQTLVAMGIAHPENAVRFSFGKKTSLTEVREAARIVNRTVENLIN